MPPSVLDATSRPDVPDFNCFATLAQSNEKLRSCGHIRSLGVPALCSAMIAARTASADG
jgi:hypothetical protein